MGGAIKGKLLNNDFLIMIFVKISRGENTKRCAERYTKDECKTYIYTLCNLDRI